MLGFAGLAGFAGAEEPQPVDTEVRPPVFLVFSSSFFARSDRPVFAFQPPLVVEDVPQPVDTGVRDGVGFFGVVAGAEDPQPVAVGRRDDAFPTVMRGSLFPTARSGTSCRGR